MALFLKCMKSLFELRYPAQWNQRQIPDCRCRAGVHVQIALNHTPHRGDAPKVALAGYYGRGNFGDDLMAVLFGFALRQAGADFTIYRLGREEADRFGFKTADSARELLGRLPVFGICLGHQILGLAVGGRTYKLPFGHHGANHPVKRVSDGAVEITSHNHGFAVDPDSLRGLPVDLTHYNLNDGTLEGFRLKDVAAMSVQYHPEASPGPHDARYLFDRFAEMMAKGGG